MALIVSCSCCLQNSGLDVDSQQLPIDLFKFSSLLRKRIARNNGTNGTPEKKKLTSARDRLYVRELAIGRRRRPRPVDNNRCLRVLRLSRCLGDNNRVDNGRNGPRDELLHHVYV